VRRRCRLPAVAGLSADRAGVKIIAIVLAGGYFPPPESQPLPGRDRQPLALGATDVKNGNSNQNRREFVARTGVAAAAALASVASPPGAAAADAAPAPINALLPTPEQMQAFSRLPDDSPVVMVNLLKFKPNGGEAEYAKYAAGLEPILKKLGAKVLFAGKCQFCLIGHADWDVAALVQYPRKKVLVQMAMSPEYRAIHRHREAGLQGQVNYAVVAVDTEAGGKGNAQPGPAKK
jgi:uncharacterized protein (DUF1330 family)